MNTNRIPTTILMSILVASAAFAAAPAAATADDLDCSEHAARLKDILLEDDPIQLYATQRTKFEDFTRALEGTIEKCQSAPPVNVRTNDGAQASIHANAILAASDCPAGIATLRTGTTVTTTITMPGINKSFTEPDRLSTTLHLPGADYPTVFDAPTTSTDHSVVNVFGVNAGGATGLIYVGPTQLPADPHYAEPKCNAEGVCAGEGWAEIVRKISETELLYIHTEGTADCP